MLNVIYIIINIFQIYMYIYSGVFRGGGGNTPQGFRGGGNTHPDPKPKRMKRETAERQRISCYFIKSYPP